MLQAFLDGFLQVLQWPTFGFMLVGTGVGFLVGLLPGLGGGATLALMLPFVYKMSPVDAFAFLLGMLSVTATTGDLTSILFGIPGEGVSAALIVDGHPLAKQGKAGRALGAALSSSLLGAWIGAFALAASIPIVRPLVLSLGFPEMFMLMVLGLAFLAVLGGEAPLKGLIAGGLGLYFSMVGMDPQTGTPRFVLGQVYLWDGIGLVPAVIGLFAVPELVEMAGRKTGIAQISPQTTVKEGVWQGFLDPFRYWGVTLRCSLLGVLIGIIPGLGGGVAQWVAYGHAVQSVKDKSMVGKGAIEGIIGPGAANNSKEGGALMPTIAFGVPGSSSMALLLGAFLILGLVPGPDMLTKHLNVTFSMVWTIVIANLIAVMVSLLLLNQLAKLTFIRGAVIIPFIVLFVFLGAFATNNSLGDLVTMMLFGILGYYMVILDWPRPPLVLGLVLGGKIENYFYIAIARYGASWLLRPLVLFFLLVLIASLVYPFVKQRRRLSLKT